MDWADILEMGELLPGIETGTSYGRPALNVRGKAIAVAGREPDHFVLMVALEEVDVLIETEPQDLLSDRPLQGLARHPGTLRDRQSCAHRDAPGACMDRASVKGAAHCCASRRA